MEFFKIPFGIDKNGEVISVKDAKKEESYTCICCSSDLILKSGDIREKHFSHNPNHNCSPETIAHLLAKKLVANSIQKNAIGINKVSLVNKCSECDDEFIIEIPLNTFSRAEEEVLISGFICDVVGYRENRENLGIEIYKTHRVDENKGRKLPIHWLEVKAEDIIENQFLWRPINSRLKPVICKNCKKRHDTIIDVSKRWGIDPSIFTTQKNPELGKYIADVHTCFRCQNLIPVFWWKGVPFSEIKPPSPSPYTIQYKYSKLFGGSYYMNTCPNCKVSQGDNFLFLMNDAPFKGLQLQNRSHSKPEEGSADGQGSVRLIDSIDSINYAVNKLVRWNKF